MIRPERRNIRFNYKKFLRDLGVSLFISIFLKPTNLMKLNKTIK